MKKYVLDAILNNIHEAKESASDHYWSEEELVEIKEAVDELIEQVETNLE